MDEDIFKKYSHNSNLFSFEVDDMKFSCKEMTLGEEANFYNYYIELSGRENLAKLGLARSTKLVDVPFSVNNIKSLIDIDKSWLNLKVSERLNFMEKLESNFAGKILSLINDHYTKNKQELKNL